MPTPDIRTRFVHRARRALVRAAHAALSPGRDDLARMTGWARIVMWLQRSPAGRAKALVLPVVTPLRAFRVARIAYDQYGARAAELGAGPRWRQILTNVWLMSWYGLAGNKYPGGDYYRYQLYLPARRRNVHTFVPDSTRYQVPTWINQRVAGRSVVAPLQDKRVFAVWCARHGFPTSTTVREFRDGKVFGTGPIPDRDMFSKNADGRGGEATTRWFALGGGRFRDHTGAEYSGDEMLGTLARRSVEQALLLQVMLRNGASVADLSPKGALCTVRVTTIRPRGKAPEVLSGILRMPVGDAPVDNWGQGGLAAVIDVRTGRVRSGVFGSLERVGDVHTHHPDTGAPVEGRVLPEWGAIVDLTVRAHETMGLAVLIGWDVPITEDGPLLLEGNTDLHQGLLQSNADVGLGVTSYARYLNEYMWWTFADGVAPVKTG